MTFPTHPQTLKTDIYRPVYVHIDTDAGAWRAYVYMPERGVVFGGKIYTYNIYIYYIAMYNNN